MADVSTVLGERSVDALGITLAHEHVFANLGHTSPGALLADPEVARAELQAFREAGGGTIVDLTSAELTDGAYGAHWPGAPSDLNATSTRAVSNVLALAALSRETGVTIIAGTGHYREPFLDTRWVDRTSTNEIADELVRDLTEGFAGTGIRAGIIGEIASGAWRLTAAEERLFRASARAHLRTGATISTHATDWPIGLAQLDLLAEEGVAPEHVIIGHADTVPDADYPLEVARRGAYVQLDTFFHCRAGGRLVERELQQRAQTLRRLTDAGFADQVLISHDVCVPALTATHGGTGYTFLLGEGRDALLAMGVEQEVLDAALSTNVHRALTAASSSAH